MSSKKLFLKESLQDNHWVETSVMKPADATKFKKRETLREGNND